MGKQFEQCPACGYQEIDPNIRIMTNAMATYVRDNGRGKAVFNDDRERFTDSKGVVWVRQDVFDKSVQGPKATTETIPLANQELKTAIVENKVESKGTEPAVVLPSIKKYVITGDPN
jgi:hypothetical protein